ncbi:MAG: transposase [Pseudonocardiaceae bacterium]
MHTLLPQVRITQVRVLAVFVLGLLWAKQVSLLRVAAALPLPARDVSTARRLARWLASATVPRAALWTPLLPALLADQAGHELVLVFDPTPHKDLATILVLGLVVPKRVLPLAGRVMPQHDPWPEPLRPQRLALGREVQAALPPGCTVTLVADRGLTGAGLLDVCRALGWHFVLRVNVTASTSNRVRPHPAAPEQALWELVTGPGQRWTGTVEVFKKEGWRAVELTIWWAVGAAEPWVLASDRPAGMARVREYRRRMRAEATDEDCKSRGWHIERSKVTQLDRLERLVLVVHLALWWAYQLGCRVVRQGQRRQYDRADRRDLSLQRLGLAWRHDPRTPERVPPLPFRQNQGQWRFAWLT